MRAGSKKRGYAGGGVLLVGSQALDAIRGKTVESRRGVVSANGRIVHLVSYDT